MDKKPIVVTEMTVKKVIRNSIMNPLNDWQ